VFSYIRGINKFEGAGLMFSPQDDQNSNTQDKEPKIIVDGQEINVNQFGQASINKPTRRRSFGCGCSGVLVGLLIAIAIIGGVGIGVLAVFNPNLLAGFVAGLTGVRVPETRNVPGNASSFDPFGSFSQVQAFAGSDAQLLEISANYVRSDGMMDLTATYSPAPSVDYKFAHEVARPSNAAPVGAGGTTSGPWYESITVRAFQPGQRRHVSVSKNGVRTSFDYVNDGMVREVGDPTSSLLPSFISAPKCATADLWKTALERDAPKDAVAIIRYDSRGYSFIISGARINLQFDPNCKLITR
jgi:hypothetical protein